MESNWLPMDQAPKDWAPILVKYAGGIIKISSWRPPLLFEQSEPTWVTDNIDTAGIMVHGVRGFLVFENPIGWMHLPK